MAPQKNSFIINRTYDGIILKTIVRRYWWWPILFIGVMVLGGFFYLRYTKPVYESTAILQIASEDNAKAVLDVENFGSKKDDYYSQVELIRSELLFEQALNSLNLNVSLFSRGEILTEENYQSSSFSIQPYSLTDSSLINQEIRVLYDGNEVNLIYNKNGKTLKGSGKLNGHVVTDEFDVVVKSTLPSDFIDQSDRNELYFTFNSLNSLTRRLISGLQVTPIDEAAQTIKVSYKGNNSQLCHDLSMAVVNAFLNYTNDNKKKGSENILSFIDTQLDSLSLELKKSKDSLMNYQRSENLPDPDAISLSLRDDVDKIQEELFQLEDEINTLHLINRKLNESPNRLEIYRLFPELMGKSYEASIASHIEGLHLLLEEKEDLMFRVTEESAEVKRVEKKIQEKVKLILRSVNAIESRLAIKAKVLRTKVMGLEGDYLSLPEKRMEFNRLKNIQDLNEKYFQLLTEKKVLYSISDAGYSSDNRILSKAEVSLTPVAPNRKMIYASFTLLGLMLGLGVMFFKYVTFNEINQLEDLEAILPARATILGGVPQFQYNLEYSQLIVADAPKSIMAEAMRKIRTNLSYIKPDFKTIAISSSISGEGKTFVALNLAGIISMSGKKTIIIDLDMRKPKIHLGFGVENTHGMSGLIIGQSTYEQCIHKGVSENLDFITAGPVPPNPSELLLSKSFNKIIDELKEMYDVIVIDNPPVGLVSDGVKLLTDADIPIYVFKSHYSQRNFALRVKELFEMQQLTSLSVILNGIKKDKNPIYGYGYGYGYGYMDQDEDTKFKQEKSFSKLFNRFYKKNANK